MESARSPTLKDFVNGIATTRLLSGSRMSPRAMDLEAAVQALRRAVHLPGRPGGAGGQQRHRAGHPQPGGDAERRGTHQADWSAAAFARLKTVIVTGMKNQVRFIQYGIEVVRAKLRGERLPLPVAAPPDTS